ncbi:MAG: glycosyltransferase family 2 protein [Flavobacteriaceae bacterium]
MLLSVIMSVYNAEKYIEEAIQSVLNQTYNNFEFIIINDGSEDNSLKIIEKFLSKDDRIILIDRENKGLVSSLNEGILKSKGNFIARMDADDICLPNRFEEQLNFMKKNSDVGVCGSWIELFGDDFKTKTWKIPCNDQRLKAELLFSSCFAHPSVMIRKNVLIENNMLYDESYIHAEDFELWIRLSEFTNFANINKVLLKYRMVKDSVSHKADLELKSRFDIFQKIFNKSLKRLDIKNSLEENTLHFNLSFNKRLRQNSVSSFELKSYFDKILKSNRKTKIFSDLDLKKVMGKKWIWNFIYTKNINSVFSMYFIFGIYGLFNNYFSSKVKHLNF